LTPPTIHALYIDDEPVLLEVTKVFLELDGGIELTVMEDVAEALTSLQSRDFDVIVSDYQMPAMDGVELLKALKATGDTTPFILFTGKGREEVAIEAINNGADFYLQKGGDPKVQFRELRNAIFKLAQKRATEKALQESERKYRELVECSNSIILRIDTKGQIQFINEYAQSFFGYTWDEIVGRSIIGTITPMIGDHEGDVAEAIDALVRHHIENTCTISQNIKGNGEKVWIAWTNKVITDEQGRVKEVLSIGGDMTALHQTEEKLKASVSLLKATLESTTDGILVVDLDQDVVAYNTQFLEMWNLEPALEDDGRNLLGEVLEQLKDPDRFQERASALAAERERSSSDVLEFIDGRAFEMITRPQRSEDGVIGRVWSFHDITDRRRAENALKVSEARLRAIFENTTFGIALADPDGKFIEVNPAMEALTGLPYEELTAMSLPDIIHTEDLGKDVALFDEMLEGSRDGYQIEKRLLGKNGRNISARLTVSAVRDELGRMRYDIWLVEDLSEKVLVEGALKIKQEELAIITSNMQDLITRVDTDGKVMYASPSIAQVLGYSPEEFIGKTHLDIIHPDSRQQMVEIIANDKMSKGISRLVARYLRRDGRYIWMETRGSVVLDEEGESSGAVLCSRDVSDAKAAELALREREEKLRLITDNMNDMITQVDREGTISYASPSVRTLLGYGSGDRTGQNIFDNIHPEDRGRVRRYLAEVIEKGTVASTELRYLRSNGEYLWLESVGSPLKGPDGQTVGLVLSSRDVTARREAEEEVYNAERKFRGIFDHANDALLIMDGLGRILEANQVACQRLGYTHSEMLCLNVADLDRRYRHADAIGLIDGQLIGPLGMIETAYISKDGRERPVEVNSTPMMFDDERAILCIARDISERKDAERRLLKSEHLLQQTQSTAHIGGYHIDLVNGQSEWTDEAFRICGIDPIRDWSKRDEYLKLVLPQDRELVNQAWWEMPERDTNIDFVYRLFIPGGHLRYIHNRGRIELNDGGDVVGIFGTIMDVTDLKEAERKLKESQTLLVEAQKLSRTGSYRYDLDTWGVKWSDGMFQLLGLDPDQGELTIKQYWALVHPDDLPGLKGGLRRAVDTRSTYDLIYRVRVGTDLKILQSTGKVVATVDGTPSYLIGTSTDVTERMRAEEEKQNMERRFHEIFDSANDIILIVDPRGKVMEANTIASRRLGFTREELLEIDLSAIVEPSLRPELPEILNKIMEAGEMLFESHYFSKGGVAIPVEISCKVVNIEGQEAILFMTRDITERKDAERRLMESRRLLAEAENASKMGSFRVNWANGKVQTSEELNNIMETDNGNGLDMAYVQRCAHPEDWERLAHAVELINSGQSEVAVDFRMISADGTIKYLQVKTRLEYGTDGQALGLFGTVMDITDRVKAEQAAKLADLKILLLGDITRHDVHNKVTALSGYLQLAEMRSADPAARELIAKARLAAQNITHQMSFAREYQALGMNEARWIDLAEACHKGVVNMDLGPVRVRIALDGYQVLADPMLEKVFHNLVENSVRYGRTASSVELTATIIETGLLIVCQDNGIGIADEDRPRLFDWEFRGRRGHGLHLIGEVLRISGMSIREVGEDGQGSRFEILVPSGRFRIISEGCRSPKAEAAPG
jgi:PAS domain S-box-containing protein